jgi:hypothetical protein
LHTFFLTIRRLKGGPDDGSYFNENFVRHDKMKCLKMRRVKIKSSRSFEAGAGLGVLQQGGSGSTGMPARKSLSADMIHALQKKQMNGGSMQNAAFPSVTSHQHPYLPAAAQARDHRSNSVDSNMFMLPKNSNAMFSPNMMFQQQQSSRYAQQRTVSIISSSSSQDDLFVYDDDLLQPTPLPEQPALKNTGGVLPFSGVNPSSSSSSSAFSATTTMVDQLFEPLQITDDAMEDGADGLWGFEGKHFFPTTAGGGRRDSLQLGRRDSLLGRML